MATSGQGNGQEVCSVLERNIQALLERRQAEETALSLQERIADRVTRFTGSILFVYFHLLLYGTWRRSGLGAVSSKFDPSFVILAMEASVEAIFLSTFILITRTE